MSDKRVKTYHDGEQTSIVAPMGVLAKESERALRARLPVVFDRHRHSPPQYTVVIHHPMPPKATPDTPTILLSMGSGMVKLKTP